MDQIFVSYARADKDFVDSLARDIEEADRARFDVWTDRADISGGDDWNTAISRAIRGCSQFLIVLSPNSTRSTKVGQELSLADKHEKRIIPLMYQPCDIPEEFELLLVRQQVIDFTQDYNEALQRLRGALGQKRQANNEVPRQRQFTPPPPPQLSLVQVLPGQWVATIMFPMMPPTNISVWMAADGSFQAQMMPMGSRAQGRWSVDLNNQVYMQGMETNGFMTVPFVGGMRVLTFDRNQLNGVGPRGEQVIWQRAG